MGETARTVSKVVEQLANTSICNAEILPCHELENLLPVELLKEILHDGGIRRKLDSAIGARVVGRGEPFWMVDLKNGLRGWQFIDRPSDGHIDFCHKIHQAVPKPSGCCTNTRKCNDDEDGRENCRCVIIPGLGSKLVEKAALLAEEQSSRFNNCFGDLSRMDPQVRSTWIRISAMIFAWGCSLPVQRVLKQRGFSSQTASLNLFDTTVHFTTQAQQFILPHSDDWQCTAQASTSARQGQAPSCPCREAKTGDVSAVNGSLVRWVPHCAHRSTCERPPPPQPGPPPARHQPVRRRCARCRRPGSSRRPGRVRVGRRR